MPFVPHRLEDGYDLSDAGVRAAQAAGAKVVITADCGTNAHAAVRALMAAGIDVIISDHHLSSGPMPDCLAVLNPRQADCEYPDKDLAAAGVVFKLALGPDAAHSGRAEAPVLECSIWSHSRQWPTWHRSGARIGCFVRYGLRLLANSPTPGLRALVRTSGLEGTPLTAGRVGFILAPRLNAVGRIGQRHEGRRAV